MLDELKLPRTVAKRLEKVAAISHIKPKSILETALKDRPNYLEWKAKAIAEGQADLDNGRVVNTARFCIAGQTTGATCRKEQKKQFEWSARSERDLLAIGIRIETDNPTAAVQVVDYIISQAGVLTSFPLMGRIPKPGAPRGPVFYLMPV